MHGAEYGIDKTQVGGVSGVTLLPPGCDFFHDIRLLQIKARQFKQFYPAADRVGGCCAACQACGHMYNRGFPIPGESCVYS